MRFKRSTVLFQQIFIISIGLLISFFLTACANHWKTQPATLDELNESSRYPESNTEGLFSGEQGYFELLPEKNSED